jgi:hypothetical protein
MDPKQNAEEQRQLAAKILMPLLSTDVRPRVEIEQIARLIELWFDQQTLLEKKQKPASGYYPFRVERQLDLARVLLELLERPSPIPTLERSTRPVSTRVRVAAAIAEARAAMVTADAATAAELVGALLYLEEALRTVDRSGRVRLVIRRGVRDGGEFAADQRAIERRAGVARGGPAARRGGGGSRA